MPPEKDPIVYVEHMLESARRARSLVAGKDRASYDSDLALRLALAHLVQIIGEGARLVPDEWRARAPDVPWSLIVGMRHKIVHDYLFVDEDSAWQVVERDRPELIERLRALVEPR